MNNIDRFRAALDRSERVVGFTGAGISTESGIPDYRSQGGIWDKFQPVYLDEFLADVKKGQIYLKLANHGNWLRIGCRMGQKTRNFLPTRAQ